MTISSTHALIEFWLIIKHEGQIVGQIALDPPSMKVERNPTAIDQRAAQKALMLKHYDMAPGETRYINKNLSIRRVAI